MNNNKNQITISRNMEKKMTLSLTVATLIAVNMCLPALVLGGVLYWIFGS